MLIALVLFPMIAAAVCAFIGKNTKLRNAAVILAAAVEFALAILIAAKPDLTFSLPGVAGCGLMLETDGFRRVYLVVIAFLWLMTMLFSPEYFAHYKHTTRYFFFNLMTLGATMGVFLAGDLFTALVFFEIMSFTSYTWVLQEETPGAIRAANTYLAIAVIGGLAALMGIYLLQHIFGTTKISALAMQSENRKALYAAGGCVLVGFGAKAGMFPLHIWLPKAHPAAPAPASALLSGLLTKSGIFGVLVLSCRLFAGDPAWGRLILILGVITMLLGAVLALLSVDLKRTLACSSVSQIGFILTGIGTMVLLGHENALAARGTLLHMVNHSLFKLVLFTCAGVVVMNLHRLNLNEIRGFGRKKPLLAAVFLIGALGIGGFPGLSGYVSKTLLHEGIVELAEHGGAAVRAVEWLFLVSGGMTVAYMTKLFSALFIEKNADNERQAAFDAKKHYMAPLSAAALVLSAAVIPALGLLPHLTMDRIADAGTDFFRAGELAHSVHYFAWGNLRGGLISIAIGFTLYFGLVRTLLMKKENGRKVYVDRLPAWLDLEELVYRPLLIKLLPAVLGAAASLFGENKLTAFAAKAVFRGAQGVTRAVFDEEVFTAPAAKTVFRGTEIASHAFSDLTDGLVYIIRRLFFRERDYTPLDGMQATLPYRAGRLIDRAAIRRGREKPGERSHAVRSYQKARSLRGTMRGITGSLSFALLMLVLAISIVFIYLMLIR